MSSSIKYSKIISDICPGMIVLIILFLFNKEFLICFIQSLDLINMKLGLLSFSFVIFLSIFIGKIVNLLGYVSLRIQIRYATFIILRERVFQYYNMHFLLIKIESFDDYLKLRRIKSIVKNFSDTMYDFDNDESVKRLMRTTTYILFMLAIVFCIWQPEIKHKEYNILLVISILCFAMFCFFITCFIYVYLYYKYVEYAIIATRTRVTSSENSQFICDNKQLNNLINSLYIVLNTQKENNKRKEECTEIKIE